MIKDDASPIGDAIPLSGHARSDEWIKATKMELIESVLQVLDEQGFPPDHSLRAMVVRKACAALDERMPSVTASSEYSRLQALSVVVKERWRSGLENWATWTLSGSSRRQGRRELDLPWSRSQP